MGFSLQNLANAAKKKAEQAYHNVGNDIAHIGAAPHPVQAISPQAQQAIQSARYGVLAQGNNGQMYANALHQAQLRSQPSVARGLNNAMDAINNTNAQAGRFVVQNVASRPAMEVAQSVRQHFTHNPSSFTPGSNWEKQLFGDTRIDSIQKVHDDTGGDIRKNGINIGPVHLNNSLIKSKPVASVLGNVNTALHVANDVPVVGTTLKGVIKGGKVAAPAALKGIEQVAPKAVPAVKAGAKVIADQHAAAGVRMNAVNASNNEKRQIQRQLKGVNQQMGQQPLGPEGARGTNVLMGKQDNLQAQLTQNRAAHSTIQNPIQTVTDRLLTVQPGLTVGGPNALRYMHAKKAGKVFDGVDGKPRFEIDDSEAKINNLQGKTLGDVLDHPQLYKNYPDLKNTPVVMDNTLVGKKGEFDGKTLRLNPKATIDAEGLRRTILHENQHNIQDIEKFASGGSPETFRAEDYGKIADEMGRVHNKIYAPNGIDKLLAPMQRSRLHKKFDGLIAESKTIDSAAKNNEYTDKYYRLAGEAEARAVEARASMSPAYRDAKPFYNSLDVPKKDLIVRHSKSTAMSMDVAKTAPVQSTTPALPRSRGAVSKPETPASTVLQSSGGSSLDNNTAESRFPLRMMEDPRTDPIRPTLQANATHNVKHNADVLSGTGTKIAENEDQALSLAKRGNSTEANATAMQLMNKYLGEGNYEKARDLVQTVAPRFTRQGQETQILAAYSKLTPAGALRYANSELAHAVKDTPKGRALEDATVTAERNLKAHAQEVADQLGNEVAQGTLGKTVKAAKTPEQMLANRIKATTEKTPNEPDPIKDMVNTLHSVAKEVLPKQGKTLPRDPMQLIGQAIKDKQGYGDVYDKAKALVLDKYKDNPAALDELDKYFTSGIERTYSKGQLNKGVQNGLKGTDLSKIVKQHFTKVDETGQALQDKLIQQAGLSKSEASQLSGDIQKRYDELVSQRKDSIIKQMFGDKPKPEQVTAADRILTMNNLGALSRDELRPLVAKKLGIPSLSEEATKNISGMANKIQTLAEGSPERARATVEMMRYIAQQVPQSATGKAVSVWKAGLLSGVKTQQGNALSNATFAGLKKVSDIPAVAVDKGIGMFTGKRTIGLTSRGSFSGSKQGVGTGWNTMRTGIDMRQPLSDGKYEQHAELSFKNGPANNLVAKPANTIFRGMSAADQPFYYGAKQNSLFDQAKAAGLTQGLHGSRLRQFVTDTTKNPADDMVARANQEATKAVLGNDTVASRAITAVKRSIDNSDMSPAGKAATHTVIDVLAPFTKVPSAFIGRTVDFTPLGIPKAVISQVSHGQFDQRALSQAIGEGVTGTGVLALGVALAQKNLISGDYPKNDQKEQQRWKAEKVQPNSVKIGNKWISMNYIGPAGLLFNAGKQIADAAGKGEGAMTQAFSAVGGLGQGLLGQSFLQGFSGFTNAITDPQRSLGSYVRSQASSIVPSIANDIANVTDPMQRQADTVGQAIRGRIPVVRNKTLQPKQDVYGNPLTQPAGQIGTLLGWKPSNSTTGSNPVLSEVNRLHTVDPNNSDLQVTPTPVGKTVTIPAAKKGEKSTDIPLTTKQRYDLQKQVGQATQDNWNKIIKSGAYQSDDDAGKAKRLTQARQDATELATRKYVVDNNLGTYAKAASRGASALASGDLSKYTGSSSGTDSGTTVSTKIDAHSQKVLNEYNNLDADTRQSKAYKENDYDYKVAQAKYDNDKANGKLSRAQDISRQDALKRAKVGADFSKDIRETYSGLSKDEVYNLITTDGEGKQIADQLLAYGDALKQVTGAQNKFRTSKGAVSFKSAGRGGSRSTGAAAQKAAGAAIRKQLSSRSASNSARLSLASKLRSSTVKKPKASLSSKIASSGMKKYKSPTLYRKKVA